MDIQLIDVDPTTREVYFKLKPKKVTGISKLVQIVVLSLMNVSGRDVLDPSKGGGLPALVGSNIDPSDSTEIYAEVARRIRKTEEEIIADQVGIGDSTAEKLSELQIVEIKRSDLNIDEIFVRIRVINQEGRSTDIVV